MKWYIRRILILFCLLVAMGVIFDNTGIATVYACDLEDDDDYWQFDNEGDDWWTYLPEVDCTPNPPASDDTGDDDLTPNWDTDNNDDDWDEDPCVMGDCDDLYDDSSSDTSKEEDDEYDDCDSESGMQSVVRRMKGKGECVEDCMGVKGGKAYTKECNGETICIDGNNGTFTNTLTGEALEKFEQVEEEMQQNCLRTSLMNNLNEHYGIQIDYSASQRTPGSFNPCNYSIVFNSVSGINVTSVTAELFHAYQEQYLEGLLSTIQNSADHKGGSNIEAEEKAFGLLCGFSTWNMSYNECYELLAKWCFDFYTKYENQHSSVVLTDEEKQKWFEAVDEFRECNQGEIFSGTLYDSPMDETLLPSTLLNLWNQMEYCSDNWSVRPIIGKTTITSNKWKRLQ